MKKNLSAGVSLLIVVAALAIVALAYYKFMPKEEPLPKGTVTPDMAPPVASHSKPGPGAK